MLNQKKLEIFLVKIRKSLAKQFLEVALIKYLFIICFKPNWAMCCYCICVALLVYEYCTVDANALRGEKRAYRYVVL